MKSMYVTSHLMLVGIFTERFTAGVTYLKFYVGPES